MTDAVNFWDVHTFWFLIAITMFPRITMLVATAYGGGILYWIGWLLAPRLTVAIIASIVYWETNPVLVVISWICALGGETAEKHGGAQLR